MDLPPSGWYPDPYGTPGLLRWWDGFTWTQHTHRDEAGGAGGEAASGVQATTVQATTVQPSSGSLSRTQPPTGPPTSPQPALPTTTVQSAVQSTRVQAPVQSTAFQPTAFQPTAFQPGTTQQGPGGADGTQVLFLGGDSWQAPGGPGTLGGPPQYGYGYQEARRRRRLWLIGGLAGGTAVTVAVIAIIVAGLSSPPAPTADQSTVTPPSPSAASPTPVATSSASPSATTTAPAATLSDGQSGLSYTQLTSPWQTGCPSALNNGAFTWTFGESAVAGQVNGGQTTWYGEACSGPLPQQYGYTGVANLESTATNLANTFQNAYYGTLNHTATQEVSQPVQISGHAGWEYTYLITYTNAQAQGVTWADEQAAVVVADTGTGNTPAVFFTSIPASLGESHVNSLVSSLQLTVVPQTGGSPAAGGSPADNGGSPNADNGNGNGNNP